MFKSSKRSNVIGFVVLTLIAIGLLSDLLHNPLMLLIPVVVFGGIFLLYKYPPAAFRGGNGNREDKYRKAQVTQMRSAAEKSRKDRTRSKTVPFKVIEGGKGDDDMPKYH